MRLFTSGAAVFLLAPWAHSGAPDWDRHPENEWVKQSPRDGKPAPKFSWEGSGAFDPFHKKWIHWGGHDGVPQGFPLFTFDLATGVWEQKFPNTSPAGVCCIDGANVFDEANRRFVRFPGASLGHGYQWSRGVKLKNSAVWLYDLATNTWHNMRPAPYKQPLAREGFGSLNATGTYDPVRELALSFGGQGSSGGTNNLHAYDAHANRLYRLKADNPPSPRDGMGLAYDSKNDCLVLFGSQYASDEKTWLYRYSTAKWESHDLDPHPVGKKLGTYSTIPRLAYDSRNGVVLGLTWDTNSGKHETWLLDVGKLKWTKMSPPVEAEASMSRSRNLSYSADLNLFILETQVKGKGPQIWTYRYKKAAPDDRPEAPNGLKVVTQQGPETAQATLSWAKSPGKIRTYEIFRAVADSSWQARYEMIGATDDTKFIDRNVRDVDLQKGKICFYRVRAVAENGKEGNLGKSVRTQPAVVGRPIVSVVAADKIEVRWNKLAAADIAGYDLYRGKVVVRTVSKGEPKPWRDNDPEYPEPMPVEVKDITDIRRLNGKPLQDTTFVDRVDLREKDERSDYKFAVYAYIVKAVNQFGTESGPSPYALTIPSEPTHVLSRANGDTAELKWQANPEKDVAGYRVYKLAGTWNIVRVSDGLVKATNFMHKSKDTTRYWITAVDALGQEGEPSSPVWHKHDYKGFYAGDWHQ
jgi:hypothetical protein